MTFREDMKKLVPMSSVSLNRRMDNLFREIDTLKADIVKIGKMQDELEQSLQEYKEDSLTFFREMQEHIDALNERLDTVRTDLTDSINKSGQNIENKADLLSKQMETTGSNLRSEMNISFERSGNEWISRTDELKKQINEVKTSIPNQKVYWNNKLERTMSTLNYREFWNESDFREKYLNLISGLDSRSIAVINDILARVRKIVSSKDNLIDLFTREEQEQLRLLQDDFNSKIVQISDDLFAWKHYLLPVRHFESSVFYYRYGIDNLKHPERIKGKTILDVGGFIGDSVLVLSELDPIDIYTFEADPANYDLLLKTIELNHITNVTAENKALGAEETTLTLHTRGSMSTLIERPGVEYKDIEVPVIRLDQYVKTHPMEIGLIKIDIEGGEPGFLAGAKETICTQRPTLLLSIYHNIHDFLELKPLLESWNLGYHFRIHKPTMGSTCGETILLAELE